MPMIRSSYAASITQVHQFTGKAAVRSWPRRWSASHRLRWPDSADFLRDCPTPEPGKLGALSAVECDLPDLGVLGLHAR